MAYSYRHNVFRVMYLAGSCVRTFFWWHSSKAEVSMDLVMDSALEVVVAFCLCLRQLVESFL